MVERERRYRRPRTQGGSSQTTGGPPQRPRKKPLQLRLAVCLLLLLLLLAVAAGRVAWIQVVQGGDMKEKAMAQLEVSRDMQSPRGSICDRNGNELAVSVVTKSLYANPDELRKNQADVDSIVGGLAPILGIDPKEMKEDMLLPERKFVWLKRRMDAPIAAQAAAFIKQYQLPGFGFLEENKRYYPNEKLAAQLLGFVGSDDQGLEGLEAKLDSVLKGSKGKQNIFTDNQGRPIFQSVFSLKSPEEGRKVLLTIDQNIQFIVEQSLDKAMAATGSAAATAIVMDPKTGDVLAMVSRPTYNPNQFWKGGPGEWRNRAVANVYEPGSTFKSIVLAAALNEGTVHPGQWFQDNGAIEVSGRRIQNWSGESYGAVPLEAVIKQSLNTGFVQIGLGLGGERLTRYARDFGFGRPTGIDLAGEEEGILFEPKDMRDSDIATMAIGQSIAITPLQLVTAVSALANDGVLLKPHIIKEVQNGDGSVQQAYATEVVRRVIRSETAQTLKGLLEKVVSEGGGGKAAVKGYRIAGKTGTAEKLREDGGGYYQGRYIASFAGFAPVEEPRIAVLVVLDDPRGVYYGGQIAAPVAGEIFSQIFRYLNILPSGVLLPEEKKKQSPAPQPVRPPAAPLPPLPAGQVRMPNLQGKTMRQAAAELHKEGLFFRPVGGGLAVSQEVPPGAPVSVGSEIGVSFSEN